MKNSPPLGVGVVGCGQIGLRRAVIAAKNAGSRVVAVADQDSSRAQEVARETGAVAVADWGEVVQRDDVHVVIVATAHNALAPISIAALQAGKDVLCEKPMCLSSQQAKEVIETLRSSGRQLEVGFNHRYHPAIRRAHELARRGEVGELLYIRCRYGHGGRPGYEQEWRMDPALSGGGELFDQGIHAIDLSRWFLGDFNEVAAMTANFVWQAPVEDNVFALLRSSEGKIASIHASWTQWKNIFSFEIFGKHGVMVVEGLGGSYGTERLTIQLRSKQGGAPDEEVLEFSGPDLSWEDEWSAFLSAIQAGQSAPIGAEDGLAAIRLVEAVYRASESGAHVFQEI